jgi:hypothetical protein
MRSPDPVHPPRGPGRIPAASVAVEPSAGPRADRPEDVAHSPVGSGGRVATSGRVAVEQGFGVNP